MVIHGRPKPRSPLLQSLKLGNTEKMVCTNCEKEGHTISRCWAEGGREEGKGPRWSKSKLDLKGKQKETSENVTKGDQSPSPLLTIYILHNEDALISQDTPTSINTVQFIVDSGASAHMCPHHSYFSSYWKLNPLKCIWVANNHNQTIKAISISNIEV